MVLARKYMQMTAIVCLMLFVFAFVVPASLATLLKNLAKAWSWLRQTLSAIGLIELTINNLRQDNSILEADIDRLNGRIAYYNRYLSNLQGQLTREVSEMRQKEGELATAEANDDQTRVNRLRGDIRRLQRRIDVIRNSIDGIDSSIRSLDRQIRSKRDKIDSNNRKIESKKRSKESRENEADRARDTIDDIDRQIEEYQGQN